MGYILILSLAVAYVAILSWFGWEIHCLRREIAAKNAMIAFRDAMRDVKGAMTVTHRMGAMIATYRMEAIGLRRDNAELRGEKQRMLDVIGRKIEMIEALKDELTETRAKLAAFDHKNRERDENGQFTTKTPKQ